MTYPENISFQTEIQFAIRTERSYSPNSELFVIEELQPHPFGALVKVRAANTAKSEDDAVVDERFRNAHVHGAAIISTNGKPVTVDLDEAMDDLIILKNAVYDQLQVGQVLELRSYDFFIPLLSAYKDSTWCEKAHAALKRLSNPQKINDIDLSDQPCTACLSSTQAAVLSLIQQDVGFNIGPPGTGKTETTAILLAAYLMEVPQAKVLLTAVANFALDQVLERTDEILKAHGRDDLRMQMVRYGSGVGRNILQNLAHLLPGDDDPFMAAKHTSSTGLIEAQLSKVPYGGNHPRIFAMTVATAIQKIEALRALAMFDLTVVEEASQANIAQVLPLMAVSKSTFFAGDPAQLSPVAKCPYPKVQRFMALSPYARMPKLPSDAVCTLTEQRRMQSDICHLVSGIAYDWKLVTATDSLGCPNWQSARNRAFGIYTAHQSVIVRPVLENYATNGPRRRREESAQEIVEMLQECIGQGFSAKDVLVITPFRAQAKHLRKTLHSHGIKGVTISTVHRTQGSARKIVIFDPVDGCHPFLNTPEAVRLMTVAFSRAEAKLIVMSSPRDLKHPILRMVQEAAMESAAKALERDAVAEI